LWDSIKRRLTDFLEDWRPSAPDISTINALISREGIPDFFGNETVWDELVVSMGGELISKLLDATDVENADYLFRDQQIIAEFKEIETDYDSKKSTSDKIDKILSMDISDVLKDKNISNLLEEPLLKLIQKSNRQIGGAKDVLKLNNGYRGLLIISNRAWLGASPPSLYNLVEKVLKRHNFGHLNGVFLFNDFPVYSTLINDRFVLFSHFFERYPDADVEFGDFCVELEQAWGRWREKLMKEVYDIDLPKVKSGSLDAEAFIDSIYVKNR
jgi:hypothetical protein